MGSILTHDKKWVISQKYPYYPSFITTNMTNMTKPTIYIDNFTLFKRRYLTASREGKNSFTYNGKRVLTIDAKYLVDFFEGFIDEKDIRVKQVKEMR